LTEMSEDRPKVWLELLITALKAVTQVCFTTILKDIGGFFPPIVPSSYT